MGGFYGVAICVDGILSLKQNTTETGKMLFSFLVGEERTL
jgi:hypothetical protein